MRGTRAVYFVQKKTGRAGPMPEMERAVRNLAAQGVQSGILCCEQGRWLDAEGRIIRQDLPHGSKRLNPPGGSGRQDSPQGSGWLTIFGESGFGEALLLCDDGEVQRELQGRGLFAAGYSHAFNQDERFDGAAFVVQEPDLVDPDSFEKIYERLAGLPWTILRTPRCLVREFVEEDLDGIYRLYDAQARLFLEAPSEDREREGEILRAYIKRIYPFYGFGYWAVIADPEKEFFAKEKKGLPAGEKDTFPREEKKILPAGEKDALPREEKKVLPAEGGELIGRVGFAPLTSQQEQEAAGLGMCGEDGKSSVFDADFGFLIRADWRGLGLAEEVSRALLEYGFVQLGFRCVRADARLENTASIRLLEALGFVPVGRSGARAIFSLVPAGS